MLQVFTNSLTLVTPTLDPLGIILEPFLAHSNHSCDPNAFVMMDGPKISLRSLRPIEADDEIFISYIDVTNPYRRRQSELKAKWFFDCTCTKCQRGSTLDEDNWAREASTISAHHKEVADLMIQRLPFASEPANYVGESRDERRLAAIQGRVFAFHEEQREMEDPPLAIEKIEVAMQLCHESGLWPLYRQPYAMLRDDYIVSLLSLGKYQAAWTQCAKRYKHILPKLYPVPFHPSRVVHTWQMAALAVYLASEPQGVGAAPGVNMAVIAMVLIKDVYTTSARSHGMNSAFAKSVLEKTKEIVTEMEKSFGGSLNENILDREEKKQIEMLSRMGDFEEKSLVVRPVLKGL